MHEAIARNYAEALFALGEEQGESVRYGDLLGGLAWRGRRHAERAGGADVAPGDQGGEGEARWPTRCPMPRSRS